MCARKVALGGDRIWGLSEAKGEAAGWGVQRLGARNGLAGSRAARRPLWLDGDRQGLGEQAQKSWKRTMVARLPECNFHTVK